MTIHLNRIRSASIFFFFSLTFIFARESLAGELRPSDHGLQLPINLTATDRISLAAGMSFFGDSHSSSSPPSPSQLLPKATAIDDGEWWHDGAENRRDHVMRYVFLAASIVCGVADVALMVIFSLVYFFKYRNYHQSIDPK